MRRPAISPHDPRVVVLGCDMTGRVPDDGRRSVLAHVQPRLGADGLRLRPVAPADALRRGRGRLPQRRRRPHLAHGPAGPGEATPWPARSATTATASSSPTTPPTPAAAAASPSTRSPSTRPTRRGSSSRRAPPTLPSPAPRVAHAAPRLDRRRAHVVAASRPSAPSASSRCGRDGGGADGAGASARPASTRAAGRELAALPSRPPAHASLRQLRPRPALGRRVRLRDAAARARGGTA